MRSPICSSSRMGTIVGRGPIGTMWSLGHRIPWGRGPIMAPNRRRRTMPIMVPSADRTRATVVRSSGNGRYCTSRAVRDRTSSKRYALYNRTPAGVVIRKASDHGLGLYRTPIERPDGWHATWPEWVEIVWRRIIAETNGEDPVPNPPGSISRPSARRRSPPRTGRTVRPAQRGAAVRWERQAVRLPADRPPRSAGAPPARACRPLVTPIAP